MAPINSSLVPEPVQIEGQSVRVYLGLGSSLGERLGWLQRACRSIQALSVPGSLRCARVYQTPHMRLDPQDETPYPDHLNTVVSFETGLEPFALLNALQEVERACGRVREPGKRWQPRTLDIDILLYGGITLSVERLTLPHPGIAHRRFVLQPLLEMLPDLAFSDGRCAADVFASDEIQNQPIEEFADASKLLL